VAVIVTVALAVMPFPESVACLPELGGSGDTIPECNGAGRASGCDSCGDSLCRTQNPPAEWPAKVSWYEDPEAVQGEDGEHCWLVADEVDMTSSPTRGWGLGRVRSNTSAGTSGAADDRPSARQRAVPVRWSLPGWGQR